MGSDKTNNRGVHFDYFYSADAEQYSFFRIPRLLVKDKRFKELSTDAKLLYGLMLDRVSLSIKNGWFDEQNRAYIIYTVDEIKEELNCSNGTVTKIMKELDAETGFGLIQRVRRGLGKPDVIYVMNFSSAFKEEGESITDFSEMQNLHVKTSNNCISRDAESIVSANAKNTSQEMQNSHTNYTNKNYTENSYIDSIYPSSDGEMDDESEAVIVSSSDVVPEETVYDVLYDLGKKIPYEYAIKKKEMKAIIQTLVGWNDRANIVAENKNHNPELWETSIPLFVECLVEMATEKSSKMYGESKVSYKNVIDKINECWSDSNGDFSPLEHFMKMCIERYVDASSTQKIQNAKGYLKTLIWNNFSTYKNDWESFFVRSENEAYMKMAL